MLKYKAISDNQKHHSLIRQCSQSYESSLDRLKTQGNASEAIWTMIKEIGRKWRHKNRARASQELVWFLTDTGTSS